MSTYIWRKSSYSGNAGNCVYVANDHDGTVKMRESDGPNATLAASPATFGVFIRAVKAGAFDQLAAD
ncbi:DUF397 domain-containing protein [Streptomyces sp. ME19-01-6]|uniref:DUF397 domain-containing protein n=1 Tax=Streptomyces sp. ME19-01-6 TaxID=3028686 RepID=UPI0029BC3F30|nr:DUF397 domain-containing protein [Streptomyces sp. ME19-01-6]MDX3226009.1 DUF397 domain-containing protein [Streptomyces sp. ME19-01-6]